MGCSFQIENTTTICLLKFRFLNSRINRNFIRLTEFRKLCFRRWRATPCHRHTDTTLQWVSAHRSRCHCLRPGCSTGWCCSRRQRPPSCPCLREDRPPPWRWARCVRWSSRGRGRRTPAATPRIPLSCTETRVEKTTSDAVGGKRETRRGGRH